MGKAKKKNSALQALVEAQLEGTKELVYNEGTENELKVKVYTSIPFVKRAEMIMRIVSLNFADNPASIDDYRPMSSRLAQKYATLAYFTDLKLPSDINELWAVVNYTTIFDDVAKIVGHQLEDIFDEARMVIDTKVKYLTNKTDLNLFLSSISKAIGEFGAQIKDIDIASLAKVLTSLKGVSNDDIIEGILKTVKRDEENIIPN